MSTDLSAVNPATGELLEQLDQQPPEALAEALAEVHARQSELAAWCDALEGELRRRLKIRGAKLVVFGDWEVEAQITRSRTWDADELEGVLTKLVEDGTIRAADAAGVIKREPKVAGRVALALRARLEGDALTALDTTWKWTERSGPVTVARSVNLLDAAPQAAEKTPPVDGKTSHGGTVPGRDVPAGASEPVGSSESPGAARAPSRPPEPSPPSDRAISAPAGPAQPIPEPIPGQISIEELFA